MLTFDLKQFRASHGLATSKLIIARIRQIKITATSIRNKDQIKILRSLEEIIPQILE